LANNNEYARLDSYRSLLKSQEAERTRVAKELHDNIGQSLTLIGIELELSRAAVAAQLPEAAVQLKKICGLVTDLGHAVSLLAHQLHSSELELLGLGAAVRGMAVEFATANQIQLDCDTANLSVALDGDIALNLFRITQETLENICKRNGATKVDIQLHSSGGAISLTIADNGGAFTSDADKEAAEMALANMRERIALVGGQFSIACKPDEGTRLLATAPVVLPRAT
jgi:signal transduction histidine kinase